MPGRYSDELRRITREQSGRQEAAASSEQGGPQKPRPRWRYGPLAVFAFILALAGVGWMLVQQMTADSKLQDCVMSGRKNCVAPVESAGR
jgi:hypothetical protein